MPQLHKSALQEMLRQRVVKIRFVKSDGTFREMNATLMTEYQDAVGWVKQTDRVRPQNPDQVSVIDVDKGAWRSFLISTLVEIDGEQV